LRVALWTLAEGKPKLAAEKKLLLAAGAEPALRLDMATR
jgi:hypothetical protein